MDNKNLIDQMVGWIPFKSLRNNFREYLSIILEKEISSDEQLYKITREYLSVILEKEISFDECLDKMNINNNQEFININNKLEHIKYGVDNSFIYSIINSHRFIANMYQYMIDYPEKFSKDIEEFKKGLDEDSLESLRIWTLQRKLGAKYISEFWRIPATASFLTDEQKIIHSTKFQIYDSISNNYKKKYDIKDIGLTIHTHYYDCGLIYIPSYIKNTFKNGIAIDGGAYIGDTAIMLYEQYDFKSIYSFEPTSKSYTIFNEAIKKYNLDDKVHLYKYALSDKNEKINIVGEYSDASILMKNENLNSEEIETILLDDFLENNNEHISLIKFDLEGYEEQALKGSEKTIIKYKPVLLISCYHDHTALGQMFRIKKYIENLNLGYKILFRGLEIESVLEYSLICYIPEQNRTEQNRTEQNRTEQNRTNM